MRVPRTVPYAGREAITTLDRSAAGGFLADVDIRDLQQARYRLLVGARFIDAGESLDVVQEHHWIAERLPGAEVLDERIEESMSASPLIAVDHHGERDLKGVEKRDEPMGMIRAERVRDEHPRVSQVHPVIAEKVVQQRALGRPPAY